MCFSDKIGHQNGLWKVSASEPPWHFSNKNTVLQILIYFVFHQRRGGWDSFISPYLHIDFCMYLKSSYSVISRHRTFLKSGLCWALRAFIFLFGIMGSTCQFQSLPESQAAHARCTSSFLATEARHCPAVTGMSSKKKSINILICKSSWLNYKKEELFFAKFPSWSNSD